MKNARFIELLDRLRPLTKNNEIRWEETASENRFLTLMKSGGVELSAEQFENAVGDDVWMYRAALTNKDGRVVETIEFEPGDPEASWIAELFSLARSRARNTEHVLDEIFSELNSQRSR